MCKVTIITVTYNAEKHIEETMESVLGQKFEDFEYIIKDGNSLDDTNRKIESMIKKMKNKRRHVQHVISADLGIYDAMNEAVKYANGEWIIFMNAGDCFYNENVLTEIFSLNYKESIGVLYGHAMLKLVNNRNFVVTYNLEMMKKGISLCHQAVFEKKEYLLKYPFDIEFRIVSDREHFLKLESQGVAFYQINSIIVREDRNGLSAVDYVNSCKESELINKKYNLKNIQHDMKWGKIKRMVKKYFPMRWSYCFVREVCLRQHCAIHVCFVHMPECVHS